MDIQPNLIKIKLNITIQIIFNLKKNSQSTVSFKGWWWKVNEDVIESIKMDINIVFIRKLFFLRKKIFKIIYNFILIYK